LRQPFQGKRNVNLFEIARLKLGAATEGSTRA